MTFDIKVTLSDLDTDAVTRALGSIDDDSVSAVLEKIADNQIASEAIKEIAVDASRRRDTRQSVRAAKVDASLSA